MKKEQIFSIRSEQVEDLRERLKQHRLLDSDWDLLDGLLIFLFRILQSAEEMRISLRRLQNLLFGKKTEKSRRDRPDPPPGDDDDLSPGSPTGSELETPVSGSSSSQHQSRSEKNRPPGHGRMGADVYQQAEIVSCRHREVCRGQACPECQKGTLYLLRDPSVEIRIVGQAPLAARRYERERLRCSACGAVLAAPLPPEAGTEKYDDRAKATVAVLKYAGGMPFNRLENLESHLGVPLPATTQWELVEEVANTVFPVYRQLKDLASQASLFYADDTSIRILSLMRENQQIPEPERKGMRTTAVVAELGEHSIHLYESGRSHAGENLEELLSRRPAGLPLPIQMTDALASNARHSVPVQGVFCLAHSRRRFHEIREFFPEVCQRVIEDMGRVYHVDSLARAQNLDPDQRLAFHQQHSAPVLEELKRWLEEQWDKKEIEPNSSLGKAVSYLLGHWKKLTGFLRIPAAPLDNNKVEKALKTPILNRKNAYYFKTLSGAAVGSVLMSLIKTCTEAGENPIEYLVSLLKHHRQVKNSPQYWLPWNYTQQLAA
jgi:transposase